LKSALTYETYTQSVAPEVPFHLAYLVSTLFSKLTDIEYLSSDKPAAGAQAYFSVTDAVHEDLPAALTAHSAQPANH
jgi:hypothetical protein